MSPLVNESRDHYNKGGSLPQACSVVKKSFGVHRKGAGP